MIIKRKKLLSRSIIALFVLLILVSGAVYVFLIRNNSDRPNMEDDGARTTSEAPTAQEDFSDGDYREPGNGLREDGGSGDIEDTNGSINSDTDTSNPLVSKTGEITVYTPKKDSVLSTGSILAGKSSLLKVSYRLIDSVSGMIASGDLSVVNGNFSGNINFTTSATEGRLDIFATRADLSEFSNVEVPVRFAR